MQRDGALWEPRKTPPASQSPGTGDFACFSLPGRRPTSFLGRRLTVRRSSRRIQRQACARIDTHLGLALAMPPERRNYNLESLHGAVPPKMMGLLLLRGTVINRPRRKELLHVMITGLEPLGNLCRGMVVVNRNNAKAWLRFTKEQLRGALNSNDCYAR